MVAAISDLLAEAAREQPQGHGQQHGHEQGVRPQQQQQRKQRKQQAQQQQQAQAQAAVYVVPPVALIAAQVVRRKPYAYSIGVCVWGGEGLGLGGHIISASGGGGGFMVRGAHYLCKWWGGRV